MAIGTPSFSRSAIDSPTADFAKTLSSFGTNMMAQAKQDEELKLQRERQAAQDARQVRMDLLTTPGTAEYASAVMEKAKLEQEANKLDPNYDLKQRVFKSGVVGTDEWKAAEDIKNEYKRSDPEYILKNKISNLQYQKLVRENNNDINSNNAGVNYIKTLNAVPQTKSVQDPAALGEYNETKNSLVDQINTHKNMLTRSKNPETSKELESTLSQLESRLGNLKAPETKSVELGKDEYIKEVINAQKSLEFKTPAELNNFQKILKDRVELLYPEKGNGLTPYQMMQEQKDQNKLMNEEKTAISLATNVFGKEKLDKLLKDNPNITPDALTKLTEKRMDKEYSSTSITDAISNIVKDADTDSNRNISAKKEELDKILKEKFKGNKADMVQSIKGYYDVQGTGTFKNWGNKSPMGDALDNFISRHKAE